MIEKVSFQLFYEEFVLMGGNRHFIVLYLFLNLLQFLAPAFSLPLCTNSEAPSRHKDPLKFCPNNGTSSCCNIDDDSRIQKHFQLMNISHSACASLLKSILCAECDKFSAELYRISSVPRQVPVLCNSTASSISKGTTQETDSFCSKVWRTCEKTPITNSIFASSLKGQVPAPVKSKITKLIDLWQSEADFCNAFGGSSLDGSLCFDGEPIALNSTVPMNPPSGLCVERLGNGAYLNMAAHPDGSRRAFFSNQQGKVWLATIPEVGKGGSLELDESSPFVDLSDEVHFDTQFGLMSIAFHPKFTQNGRFFASFNCDKQQWPGCAGRCACNSDLKCDPSKLPRDSGAQPCRYQAVVAEFTANGTTASSRPSEAKSASAGEVRRIFTMGLPFTAHHAGQILFGPADGYLYFMMGDGGGSSSSDPYGFAQNKKSLLGKILRLDIDDIPSATEVTQQRLWGNYSIPKDNPYLEDKQLQPEIWALGLQNPWRCSFDSARPSYFICGDVGKDHYEEVDIITKGGNYGWHEYEGPFLFTPPSSRRGRKNASADSINPILPVMGYNHSDVNKNEGSASIIGGYFYRSLTDPCMYGRYLFADLYGGAIWAGTENPENSGVFNTTLLSFTCSHDSPLNCSFVPGSSSRTSLGYVFSFGEDNNKDVYVLASSGVYRVVPPSRCKYSCSKGNTSDVPVPTTHGSRPPPRPPSQATPSLGFPRKWVMLLLLFLCFLLAC